MNIIKKQFLSSMLFFFCSALFASTDPIAWREVQGFPVEVFPNNTYIAYYTFQNNIPLTLAQPFVINKQATPASEFSFDDACTGKKLAYRELCTVTIYLNAVTSGTKTLQLIEQYGYDRVPVPLIITTASNTNGGTNVSGAPTTGLPNSIDIGNSAPWLFTFRNDGTKPATGLNLNVSGATYATTCTSQLNNPPGNNTCTVSGTYTAASAGPHTISATLSYTQGSSVEVETSTNGQGDASGLVCTQSNPFAPETKIETTSTVGLLCTNKSGGDITIDDHVTAYPTGAPNGTFTPDPDGGDNCTAQILNNNASCQLKGTYAAPSDPVDDVTISLHVNYHTSTTAGLSSDTSTNTNIVTEINNLRTFNLVNQCNYPVWWSMVGGSVSGTGACSSDTDCPTGSTCNISASVCYYNGYGATTGSYLLTANGGTATTQIIQTAASTISDQILWKGLISASTACSGATCLNNSCQNNGGQTSCAAGVGFDQPATEAEFTLLLSGVGNVDSYDISNVNGFSMPISMASNQPHSNSNYTCGTAGNHLADAPLKACNFSQVTLPTNMYYWVQNTGTACLNNNTCSISTDICGLAFNKSTNNFTKNCGKFLGYWAANEICQTNPNFKSPFGDNFSCTQTLSTPFPENTYTLTQLLKCSPLSSTNPLFNSCYLNYSTTTYSDTERQQCCGCTNWAGIADPTVDCPAGQIDPQWTSYVEPIIKFMKEACPTSYAYPYDDKASSFQCSASEQTEYTITFCPGGGTGLPSGKSDGRSL